MGVGQGYEICSPARGLLPDVSVSFPLILMGSMWVYWGEVGLPSLALCLHCVGMMAQNSRGNRHFWPWGACIPKLEKIHSFSVFQGARGARAQKEEDIWVLLSVWLLSCMGLFNVHGNKPITSSPNCAQFSLTCVARGISGVLPSWMLKPSYKPANLPLLK